MKKTLFIIILVLLMVAIAYAVDQKLTALTDLTAVADSDIIYIVDDPGGSPLSRKITVLNLFDTIDTFSELNTIVADKTLVNEEDAVAWDALGTFNLGITITTGDPFTLGTNRMDNGSDLLDGEMIAADTIDDDSIDFADVTGADLTLTDCGAVTSTATITATVGFDIVGAADIDYGSADVTDHTFIADGTGDAEFVVPNDSIGPAEIDSTTGAYDFGGVTSLEIPNIASGDLALGTEGQVSLKSHEDGIAYHSGSTGEISGEVFKSHLSGVHATFDPGSWYDSDAEVHLLPVLAKKYPNGVIIDYWECSCNVDPDTEISAELYYADAWLGYANAALIDDVNTASGIASEDTDANINSGNAVPAGKYVYLLFTADPEGTCVQFSFTLLYHAEED